MNDNSRRDQLARECSEQYHLLSENGTRAMLEPVFSGYCNGWDARQGEVDELKALSERHINRYRSIELAKEELTRNDHVVFGDLLIKRDKLEKKIKSLDQECQDFAGFCIDKDKQITKLEVENKQLSEGAAFLLGESAKKQNKLESQLAKYKEALEKIYDSSIWNNNSLAEDFFKVNDIAGKALNKEEDV